MFDKIEIFKMAFGMASQAAARQSVIAQNIAQADTPGYRAQEIASFAETYRSDSPGQAMRATRSQHLSWGQSAANGFQTRDTQDEVSPNGNSVSLEQEMVRASEVRQQHQMALTIYSSSLGILRTSLGRN